MCKYLTDEELYLVYRALEAGHTIVALDDFEGHDKVMDLEDEAWAIVQGARQREQSSSE